MMVEQFVLWLLDNASGRYALPIGAGSGVVVVFGLIMYITRVRDHMREEKKIDDYHFSKVKETISDSIEALEESIIQRGIELIEKEVPEPIEVCDVLNGKSCQFLQLERFETDTMKGIERLKGKITGWMRENGFHESDDHGVEKYVAMRKKHTMDFLPPYLEKRSRTRFPSLSKKIGVLIDDDAVEIFLNDIVSFSIEEQKLANKSVKDYRISHGFFPEAVAKLVAKIKGGK